MTMRITWSIVKKRRAFAIAAAILALLTTLALRPEAGVRIWRAASRPIIRRLMCLRPMEQQIPFNSADWKDLEKAHGNEYIRSQMVYSLLDHYELVGMTKRQIQDLLGEPDSKSDPLIVDEANPDSWQYFIAPDAWSIDTEELQIEFDDFGRVFEVYITQT